MQSSADASPKPELESLITDRERTMEAEVQDEDVVQTPDITNDSEGLTCITDTPMRICAYFHYVLTFSWLDWCKEGSWNLYFFCKVICQVVSFLIMLLALTSEIVLLVVLLTTGQVDKSALINSFLLEVGYNIAAITSLGFLICYSYSSKKDFRPHKLIVQTRINRKYVRRIYSSQIVRNSMRESEVDYKINSRTDITCNSVFMALWQIGVGVLLAVLILFVYHSSGCSVSFFGMQNVIEAKETNIGMNCTSFKTTVCREGNYSALCIANEILIAVNAIQRFISPVIVCNVSIVACKKIESEIKLNSTNTYTNLLITPNTADIKRRYFKIVRQISFYSEKFRTIIIVNTVCSLLGVAVVVIVRENISYYVLKVYVSYFVLLSCAWMALHGIKRNTEMFRRYPDEVFGFIANRNVLLDVKTQAELNIVANSANGNQGSYFGSGVLSALTYSLLAGMAVILYFVLNLVTHLIQFNNAITIYSL